MPEPSVEPEPEVGAVGQEQRQKSGPEQEQGGS